MENTDEKLKILTDLWHALDASRGALAKQEAAYMAAYEQFKKDDLFEWICPEDGHGFGGCQVYAANTVGALNVPPVIDGEVTCPECGNVQTVEDAQAIKDSIRETMESDRRDKKRTQDREKE